METKKDAADIIGLLLIIAGFVILAAEPMAGTSRASIITTDIIAALVGTIGAAIFLLAQRDYGRQKHH